MQCACVPKRERGTTSVDYAIESLCFVHLLLLVSSGKIVAIIYFWIKGSPKRALKIANKSQFNSKVESWIELIHNDERNDEVVIMYLPPLPKDTSTYPTCWLCVNMFCHWNFMLLNLHLIAIHTHSRSECVSQKNLLSSQSAQYCRAHICEVRVSERCRQQNWHSQSNTFEANTRRDGIQSFCTAIEWLLFRRC